MTLDTATHIIQLILAPVVMITSCSLILGGLLTRYGAVNDRMRAMNHEHLELVAAGSSSAPEIRAARLGQIKAQIPDLLYRHTLLHHAVLAVYLASALFLASMFVIALAAAINLTWLSNAILVLFLIATAALLGGVLLATVEVRSSHLAVQFETRQMLNHSQRK